MHIAYYNFSFFQLLFLLYILTLWMYTFKLIFFHILAWKYQRCWPIISPCIAVFFSKDRRMYAPEAPSYVNVVVCNVWVGLVFSYINHTVSLEIDGIMINAHYTLLSMKICWCRTVSDDHKVAVEWLCHFHQPNNMVCMKMYGIIFFLFSYPNTIKTTLLCRQLL